MKLIRLLMALVAVASFSSLALAGEDAKTVTVNGKIVCAKCSLNKDDAKECQNVIVADVDGKSVEYYITKNKLAEDFGHVCKGEKNVIATGTLKEKDGKTWITPTKMEQPTS